MGSHDLIAQLIAHFIVRLALVIQAEPKAHGIDAILSSKSFTQVAMKCAMKCPSKSSCEHLPAQCRAKRLISRLHQLHNSCGSAVASPGRAQGLDNSGQLLAHMGALSGVVQQT